MSAPSPTSSAAGTASPPLSSAGAARMRHAWLRALGREEMPGAIGLRDGDYRHLRTYKHDFFAATGLYEGPSGRVILKLGRQVSLLGVPMSWLGRFLANREAALYARVEDLAGVPRCLGRWGATGFVHAFVEGHPLQRDEPVDEHFFPRLAALLAAMHARGIAYVDLEKRENILVDREGKPCLIDFQISWSWPAGAPRRGLARLMPDALGQWILGKLQAADRYHLLKHQRRHRPQDLTPEQLAASYRHGGAIGWHRRLFRPVTLLRRAALKRLTGQARSAKQDGPEFMEAGVELRSEN